MSQSQKTLEFLQKLKDSGHWNEDYDYSEVDYVDKSKKVVIGNKKYKTKHLITPLSALSGTRCIILNAINPHNIIIAQFIEIHGDRYDYTKVNYVNVNTDVVIICRIHGEFQQNPGRHKSGNNCPKCSGGVKLSREELIGDFVKALGNRYDYSKVKYVNAHTKVIIICKQHGEFLQNTQSHKSGGICPKCYSEKEFISKIPKNEIIDRFKRTHGDNYDYSKVVFKSTHKKVKIICKEHGVFEQSPKSHTHGSGCPACFGVINITTSSYLNEIKKVGNWNEDYDYSEVDYVNAKTPILIFNKLTETYHEVNPHSMLKRGAKCVIQNAIDKTDFFIKSAKLIHGDAYDYSLTKYIPGEKLKILCFKHGVFQQSPSKHLNGSGCNTCGNTSIGNKLRTPLNELIEKFKQIHGDRYEYSLVDYETSKLNINIICKIHGVFEQSPGSHLSGSGCPICNKGWNKTSIIRFVNNIGNEDVLNMDPVELNMLIAQGKLPEEFEQLVFTLEGTKENSLKTLKENLGIEDSHELSDLELENLSDKLESVTMSSFDNEINDALVAIETLSDEDLEFSRQKERKRQGLPSISNEDILVLDKELINTCDDEAVEFFIQYKLKRVWNEVINDKRDVKDIKDLNGGKNSSRLRDLFLSEYKKVVDYIPPTGYNFKRNGEIALPNMMQKLTVQRVIDYKRYGNWSGTGAGKTISFIIASREVNSRLTVVICINSTVSQLEEDILDVYPDSKIFTHFRKGQKFNRDNYNYLLLNYEKFQQGYTEEIFQDLNENNMIDFIVLDEVHNAKQRDKDESIRRGALMRLIGRSAEMNPNFHLLGMSATPVINNLIEAKSLLQLITGKDYDDISTRGTITNALKIFNQLLLNGIRYIPKYDIILKELTAENTPSLNIDGTKLTEKLKDNDNKDYLGLEKILLESKLEILEEFLKPKTIIYTYFTDNDRIPKRIAKYVKSKGYSFGLYIGEQSTEDREHNKTSFVKGDIDILIASRIIGTGVDGLQNVCNRMILLTLPWTDSEYTQLKGRIYRQGSKFGDVEIVIPQVFVDLEEKRWSWDKQRLQLIREKRTLADAAVDGIIPSKHVPSREKLCSDSLQALKKWKIRISEGKITTIERNDLVLPLRPEILAYLKPSLGDFSEMNKSWSTARSENTHNRLIKDPSEWYYYHSLYAEKRKEWSEIPYVEIAKKIKERPEWVVADMGCGENLLSKELTNHIHAFDYVAIDENVTACDMSSVPLNSQEVDAVVFCLSLMGSNYLDYLKEAFRIIKPYGNLFICEPKKKIDNRIEEFKKDIEGVGFKIIEVNSLSSKFIYFQGIKL
jgi:superfamily II DNA or RNA helicase